MSARGNWCLHDYLEIRDDLLQYFQSHIDFISFQEEELESNGFTKCVDQPKKPHHIYYEGYFHGMETSEHISSLNPRTGSDMMKPAAPLSLRAFIASFKDLNEKWINMAIKDSFIENMGLRTHLFSDFAVQIHFGDHIDSDHVVWHYDSFNSALHLALSLHGRRALYYKPNDGMTDLTNGHGECTNNDADSNYRVHWQNAGSCYLSSPYSFVHVG